MAARNPSTWDEYEQGVRPAAGPGAGAQRTGSMSSTGARSVQFEQESLLGGRGRDSPGDSSPGFSRSRGNSPGSEAVGGEDDDGEFWGLRRRRSSITNRLAAVVEIGGLNSIRSFTKSWQRAAAFAEVIPQRPAFVFAPDQAPTFLPSSYGNESGGANEFGRGDVEAGTGPGTSLLRQHLLEARAESALRDESPGHAAAGTGAGAGSSSSHAPLDGRPSTDFHDREQKALDGEMVQAFRAGSGDTHTQYSTSLSLFGVPPYLSTPPMLGSSVGSRAGSLQPGTTGYGTLCSRGRPASISVASMDLLWQQQQQESGVNVPDGEAEPILVKEVEQDGKIILAVEGQSTLPQTVFNSINVLIGVGLLSLPMGIKYAGWLCGMVTLFLAAAVTSYTAKLLARCMDLDPSLITFSDLAFISFGRNARVATSILFTLELMAACVALIVLFADSLSLLFPGALGVLQWKILCSLVLIPLNFLPLRLLSFTSIIGILACFGIVAVVVIDGFFKNTTPGSLLDPAKTYLFPANWLTLPLSFGLLMSPWGGHGVFPNIYRDMRHPHKYGQAVKITFSFTYLLDAVAAVAGVLMFGEDVRDEITANILETSGYPRALTFLLCALIAVIPLTKIPLNARPIITTAEVLLGVHRQAVSEAGSAMVGRPPAFRGAVKVAIRVVSILCFLGISIAFPAFDSIMAFMGSALCFTICVTLPLAFYLKLFKGEISARERLLAYFIMAVSICLSLVGTVWAFLPKSLIGAEPAAIPSSFI